MQVTSVRGCLQDGVLSPLLWNLTVDELLRDLNEAGYYLVRFADDIAIIIVANTQAQSLKYYIMR